jgi:hypothetical protein
MHHAGPLTINFGGTLPVRRDVGRPPWGTAPMPALRGHHPYPNPDTPIGFLPAEAASDPAAPVPFWPSLYGRARTRTATTAADIGHVTVPPPGGES